MGKPKGTNLIYLLKVSPSPSTLLIKIKLSAIPPRNDYVHSSGIQDVLNFFFFFFFLRKVASMFLQPFKSIKERGILSFAFVNNFTSLNSRLRLSWLFWSSQHARNLGIKDRVCKSGVVFRLMFPIIDDRTCQHSTPLLTIIVRWWEKNENDRRRRLNWFFSDVYRLSITSH